MCQHEHLSGHARAGIESRVGIPKSGVLEVDAPIRRHRHLLNGVPGLLLKAFRPAAGGVGCHGFEIK